MLNILRNVREVGDAFLTGAPETVSLAWAGVSILIKIGTDDLDKCELISGCCETIVSIVLNCRLYEKRYGSTTRPLDHELYEVEQKIIESLPNLLYLILDFSWDAKYHLEKSRFSKYLFTCVHRAPIESKPSTGKVFRKETTDWMSQSDPSRKLLQER